MQWRIDQHYEDARDASYARWLASLPPWRRRRHYAARVARYALFLAVLAAFLAPLIVTLF